MNHSNASKDFSRAVGLTLVALLFIVIYGRYLIGFSPTGGDIVNQYLPYQQLIRDAVRQGAAPLWNSLTFCGRPLMADIQVGVLYPPNWLHWFLPLPLSFALVLALHGAWMMAGCWRLGHHWRLAPPAIALGTILFCANPFFSLKPSQGIILFIYVGAWWPWMALAVSRLAQRPSFGRMATLSTTLALALIAGSPQITFYGWIVAFVIGLALPLGAGEGSALRRWLGRAFWMAGAFLLALGLTAIQTAQTYHFINTSFERGGAGASWKYITDGSFDPRLFWLLVNPGFLGIGHSEQALYWGSQLDYSEALFYTPLWALALVAPLMIVMIRRVRSNPDQPGSSPLIDQTIATALLHRRLAVLGLVAMHLGFLLAMGSHSVLFKFFYDVVPGFNRFRVPARLMLFFVAGQALLAALVLQALLARERSSHVGRVMVAVGGLVGLGLLWIPWILRVPIWSSLGNPVLQHGAIANPDIFAQMSLHALIKALSVTVGLVCAAAALWVLLGGTGNLSPKARHWFPWALPALALVELATLMLPFQKTVYFTRLGQEFYPKTEVVKLLEREHRGGRVLWLDDVISWQVDQNQPELFPNRLVMQNLADARGYDPVNARWIGVWMNLLAGLEPDANPRGFMFVQRIVRPAWLTLMGVESVVSYRDLSTIPGLKPAGQISFPEGPLTVWRNEHFHGMAFAAPRPKLAHDEWTALTQSAQLANNPAARPEDAIVADEGVITQATAEGQTLAAQVGPQFQVKPLPSGPNGFRYDVNYPQPALLCLAQSAYGGWGAIIDGQPAPLSPMSGTFLATVVPAGRHEVAFAFDPEGLALGKMISLATLVALFYGVVRGRLKGREA